LGILSSENTSSTNEVSTTSGDFRVSTAGGISQIDEDDLKELDLRWQVAIATTVTEKGTLLEIADLEGIMGKDLMVTMAGAMHQQMNLHHR
ncbi:hypothetical protein Tco_0167089, partial [Tanacetum coccineum]